MAETTTGTYESSNIKRYTTPNWLYRRHIAKFLDRLLEMLSATEAGSVLDAGCGEGFVASYIAERMPGIRLTGVDVSNEAIAYARAHFDDDIRFRRGDVYKLPFSDNSFDTVLCSEVLEHLDDPNKALQELKRVARNYVLITVPHEPYFQWLNTLGRWLGVNEDAGHVNFWTPKTFEVFINGHLKDASFDRIQLYQLALGKV